MPGKQKSLSEIMKITVYVNVRNAQFYEAFETYKKTHGNSTMDIKQWAANKDNHLKIHSSSLKFECLFNVSKFYTHRNGTFELAVNYQEGNNAQGSSQMIHLDNVTVIEFTGGKKRSSVVISNELIDYYFNDKKDIGISEYLYFNLMEDSAHNRLSDNIWLSDEKMDLLNRLFPGYTIDKDLNLKIIREEGFSIVQ